MQAMPGDSMRFHRRRALINLLAISILAIACRLFAQTGSDAHLQADVYTGHLECSGDPRQDPG